MTEAIIVVNAGSTSLKFGAYAVDGAGSLPLLCRGEIDGMQDRPAFRRQERGRQAVGRA